MLKNSFRKYFLRWPILGLPWQSSWLRLCALHFTGMGSIPGHQTKVPHAKQCSQNKREV